MLLAGATLLKNFFLKTLQYSKYFEYLDCPISFESAEGKTSIIFMRGVLLGLLKLLVKCYIT